MIRSSGAVLGGSGIIPVSGASFTGLLDDYPNAAAAYSVRRLSSTYSGALIRVREDVGDTEQDIGFDANGDLDVTALENFVTDNGNNPTANGFVTTWYDQSGNSKDFIQATTANQPQVVSSGSVELAGTKLSILGLGTSLMTVPSSTAYFKFLHDGTVSFNSNVIETSGDETQLEFIWLTNNSSSTNSGADLSQNASELRQFTRNGVSSAQRNENKWAATSNSYELVSLRFDADNATAADRVIANVNGGGDLASNTRTFAASTADSTADLHLFNYFVPSNNFGFQGKYQELIFWDSDQSSNRAGIETNQNTYYSIYA